MEKAMDIVLPQYYEWHGEMEKVCKAIGLKPYSGDLYEYYQAVHENIQVSCKEGGHELFAQKGPCAIAYWKSMKKVNSVARRLAFIAYARALEHSHDLDTQREGERLLYFLFGDAVIHFTI